MIDMNMKQSAKESMKSLDEIIAQEEKYQFDSFTASDAIELAKLMIKKEKEIQKPVAFCIYLNGCTVFQYLPEGTGLLNECWFKKKIKTVMSLRWSTMRLWTWQETSEKIKRNPEMLPTEDVTPCGGGFPINVKGCGCVGVIVVSALGDQADHDFIIDALEDFREW